jgi:hypothetical protein
MTATPPRPDVADRLCKGCDQVKPMRKGCRLCDDCKPPKGGKGAKTAKRAEERVPDSRLVRPPGMGYTIELEVDENTGQTDVKVSQHNATAGVQTLWWNQREAAEIRAWLDQHLGEA